MEADGRRSTREPVNLTNEVQRIRRAIDQVVEAPTGYTLPPRYSASVHPTLPMMVLTDTRSQRQAHIRLSVYKDVRAALACLIGDRDDLAPAPAPPSRPVVEPVTTRAPVAASAPDLPPAPPPPISQPPIAQPTITLPPRSAARVMSREQNAPAAKAPVPVAKPAQLPAPVSEPSPVPLPIAASKPEPVAPEPLKPEPALHAEPPAIPVPAPPPPLAPVVERSDCRLVLDVFPGGDQQAYRVLAGPARDQEIGWVRREGPKKFTLLDLSDRFSRSNHTSIMGALARIEGVLLSSV